MFESVFPLTRDSPLTTRLHALKALLPRYAGRVKGIYIDPRPTTPATRAGIATIKATAPWCRRG